METFPHSLVMDMKAIMRYQENMHIFKSISTQWSNFIFSKGLLMSGFGNNSKILPYTSASHPTPVKFQGHLYLVRCGKERSSNVFVETALHY